MKVPLFYKNRIIWLVVIVLISLGLVGVALAAASSTRESVTDIDATPPPNQAGMHSEDSLPPSPMHFSAYQPPEAKPPQDSDLEQMRLQAMAASQASSPSIQQEAATAFANAEAGPSGTSLAPQGAGILYLPDGIVVDTYLDRIYGYVAPYGMVTILRPSDSAYGSAEADQKGFFWTSLFDGAGAGTPVDITSGELLINGNSFVVYQEPQGFVDVADDTITGTIPGDSGGTLITVTLGLYGQPSMAYGIYTATTDVDGGFLIEFMPDVHLGPENFAVVDYSGIGFYQRTAFFPQHVFLTIQNNAIGGYSEPGQPVQYTVYNDGTGDVITTGNVIPEYPFGWFYPKFDAVMSSGDRVVVDYQDGTSTDTYFVYASNFTFSGDGMVMSGTTEINVDLRVSFVKWEVDSYKYYETNLNSGPSGYFVVDLPGGGVSQETRVDVAILDDEGNGSYVNTGMEYLEVIYNPDPDLDCVWGRVDTPNTPLTLILWRNGTPYYRHPSHPIKSDAGNMAPGHGGCFGLWQDEDGDGYGETMIPFEVGDTLELRTDPYTPGLTQTIRGIGWGINAAGNEIGGKIFSGETGRVAVRVSPSDSSFLPHSPIAEARTDATPDYSVQFDNFDVRAGIYVDTYFYEDDGFTVLYTERNHYFQTIDNLAVSGHNTAPGEAITVTVWGSDPAPLCMNTNDLDENPSYFYFDLSGCPQSPPLQPGDIVLVDYQWHESDDRLLTYESVSVQADPDTNMITASEKGGMLELSGGNEGNKFDLMAPTLDSVAKLDTTSFYDLTPDNNVTLTYRDSSGNLLSNSTMGEVWRVEFWMNPSGQTGIWGNAMPNSPIKVTTSSGDLLVGFADGAGNFGTDHSTYLYPGDQVTVYAGLGNSPVTINIVDFWANSDSSNDMVTGRLIGYSGSTVEIYPWWSGEPMTTTMVVDDYFSVQYPLNNITAGARGYVRFVDNSQSAGVGAIFHRVFNDQEPYMQVNYGHEWVQGQYDPGYPVAITVTNDAGEIRATAHGKTSEIPGWGGETGFNTGSNAFWDGMNPDIQLWDHVFLTINGRTRELQLGEVLGEFDYDNDIFTVTLNIPWLTEDVWGDCGVWEQNGPGMGFKHPINPQGGTYTCDFGVLGWDLLLGHQVGASYQEPNSNNRVYNAIRDPVPHLWINQERWGEPASGNNYAIRVHFNNDGWATAPDVTLSQEFWGMTYLSDTSGFPHNGTGAPGDPIVWDVGDLPYNHYGDSWFDIFVSVDVSATSIVTSTIDIDTSLEYYQGDEWNKHFEWSAEVRDNDSYLNIGKNAWTGDPVPGTDFVYAINVCNNGSTSSSEVVVTDMLPLATTLVDWWGQNPGWMEVSRSAHQLVLSRPTVPGYWCGETYLRVHLDEHAWEGMPLHNEAWFTASSDLDPENNFTSRDQNVGSPSYNLHLDPNWVSGQFVQGGQISFDFNISNWGNMPMPGTLVTTTIPLDTEFESGYGWDWRGGFTFTPTVITDEYVVWDLGDYPNGFSQGVGIRLRIADDYDTDIPLVVENRIMGEALEYRYDDNVVVYTETVNDDGPNLRVDTHSSWGWNKQGSLRYDVRFLNLGTQTLYDVIITDTLPISTSVSWYDFKCPGGAQCIITPTVGSLVFWMSRMDPGWNTQASFNADLVGEDIGKQGLVFVNQLYGPVEGDKVPDDNLDEVISYTGPDIFIHKWLKDGALGPGEQITYTVEFGNLSKWGSDGRYTSHIIDTLPEGTTFVKAIPYWDPVRNKLDPASIIGQEVTWFWWPMGAQNTWTFDLVVQIGEDYPLGQPLLNTIEAYGDSPYDIDYDLTNNYDENLQSVNLPESFGKTEPMNAADNVSINPTLSWESSAGATSNAYCYDTTDDDACDGSWASTGNTSVDLSGLSYETTYYWQVRAVNLGGIVESDDGTWWSFTTIVEAPGAFNKLTPTNGAIDVVTNPTLSWETSPRATSYAYCYDQSDDDDACDGSWISTGSNTSIELSGLSKGTTYYWQVRALNAGDITDANAGTWWSFTTIVEAPAAFGKIAPADAAIDVITNPTLSWETSPRATSYAYCYDQTNNNACDGSWMSNGSNTSVELGGLSAATTYYWQVRAVNVGGTTYANEAAWWSFTTIVEAPGAFGKIAPTDAAMDVDTSPTLSWESSLRAMSFEYCYDTIPGVTCEGTWTSTGTDTSIALSGLSAETTYYWQVRAVNVGGITYANEAAWWSFTTKSGTFQILLPIIQKKP